MSSNPILDLDLDDGFQCVKCDAMGASSASGSASSTSTSVVNAGALSISKRRRSLGATVEILTTPVKKAKIEDDQEASPGPVADAEFEQEPDHDEGLEDKRCSGCRRSAVHGKCWINAEEIVRWALPNQRGLWCRDCFNVWRLQFADRFKLVVMPSYFRQSPEIIAEFELSLVAYISIRRGGVERVSAPLLRERMELIRWLLSVYGVPSNNFVIVPFGEITSLHSAAHLVTLRRSGAYELGAMVPETFAASSSNISRPVDLSAMSLGTRATLNSSKASDLEKFAELFGRALNVVKQEVVKKDAESPVIDMTKSGKKVSGKVRAAISVAKLILHNFVGLEWEDLKEASFTQPLNKLLEAKLEAAHEQMENMIEEAEEWHEGIAGAKLFVKKFREAMRSRSGQASKLGAMRDVSSTVHTFICKTMVPGVSFSLVRLKCMFHGVGDNLAEKLEAMASSGLFAVLEALDASSSGKPKADGWVRALLIGEIVSNIELMSSEEVSDRRVELGAICDKVQATLAGGSKDDMLAGIIEDVKMLSMICCAGSVGHRLKLSSFTAAEDHIMQTPRLALLKQALLGSTAGQELLAPLKDMKVASVTDELGEQRFALGMDCFSDKAMLKVSLRVVAVAPGLDEEDEAKAEYIVCNDDLALSSPMLIEPMLADAMANVMEACKLWGPMQLENHEDRVRSFVANLGSTLTVADFALAMDLFVGCKEPLEALASADGDVKALETSASTLTVAFQNVSSRSVSTESLAGKISNLGKSVPQHSEITEDLQVFVARSQQNQAIRAAICQLFCIIGQMLEHGFPGTPATALDQWSVRGDSSFLALAVPFIEQVDVLKKAGEFDFACLCADGLEDEKNLVKDALVVKEGGHAYAHSVTVEQLLCFPAQVRDLPLVTFACQMVRDSITDSIGKFLDYLELDGIITTIADPDGSSLLSICQSFVAPMKLTMSMTNYTRVLAAGGRWLDSQKAFDLVVDLLETSGLQEIEVGASFADPAGKMPSNIMEATCCIYLHMHHVVAALAWIATTCTGNNGCTMHHELKSELNAILDHIDQHIIEAQDLFSKHEDLWLLLDASTLKLKMPISVCQAWLAKVHSLMPDLCSHVVSGLVAGIQAVAKLVRSHTPTYEHFVNDSSCSQKLVQSRLINFACKDVLTQESVQLFKCLKNLGEFRVKHCLQPPGEPTEDKHHEAIADGQLAFQKSKQCMVVVAAGTCAYMMKGPEQFHEAEKLMERKAGLIPAALQRILKDIVAKKPAKSVGSGPSPKVTTTK
jgi:hypothetical protein